MIRPDATQVAFLTCILVLCISRHARSEEGSAGAGIVESEPPKVAGPARPIAVVGEKVRDFGTLVPGETAVARFEVRNQGDAPLVLEATRTDPIVPAATVRVEGSPVAPGQTGRVIVSLDTERVSGPGAFRVPVTTNDPNAPKIELAVTTTVKPVLFADPGHARYVTVQGEREGTIAQTIWSSDGAAFRVLAVDVPAPALRSAERELAPAERKSDVPGSQWRIETTLASDAPVGALAGDLVVTTDHPRQKRIRIPVSGFVRPVLAVTPPEADLGEVDPARRPQWRVHVKNFATEEIVLERAESTIPGLSVEILPVTQGRIYNVKLSATPELGAGPIDGVIRVFTASPKAPVIEVPVRGRAVASATAPADGK